MLFVMDDVCVMKQTKLHWRNIDLRFHSHKVALQPKLMKIIQIKTAKQAKSRNDSNINTHTHTLKATNKCISCKNQSSKWPSPPKNYRSNIRHKISKIWESFAQKAAPKFFQKGVMPSTYGTSLPICTHVIHQNHLTT